MSQHRADVRTLTPPLAEIVLYAALPLLAATSIVLAVLATGGLVAAWATWVTFAAAVTACSIALIWRAVRAQS